MSVLKTSAFTEPEWFGLEGTFGDQSVEFPHHGQGLLSLGQVAKSPV